VPLDIHRGIKLAVRYEATTQIAMINIWSHALANTIF